MYVPLHSNTNPIPIPLSSLPYTYKGREGKAPPPPPSLVTSNPEEDATGTVPVVADAVARLLAS
jgi:hypothetical protein